MVNSVSWRFTCLEAFFVSNVVAAQCLEAPELNSVCIFLEMIVCFNVCMWNVFVVRMMLRTAEK